MNILENVTAESLQTAGLAWANAPLGWEPLPGGGMRVSVPARTDFFQDPAGVMRKNDAPYLWRAVSGDFVAQAHVQPNWVTTYDAGAILAWQDETHWAKICYESTDFGTTAAVSVVTKDVSDDANGANQTQPDLWLQICRAGALFGLHYALDGRSWKMVRLCRLDVAAEIRVGLVAQCPVGPGVKIDWLSFSIEARSVQNIRAGV